jgi:hypothetical protein
MDRINGKIDIVSQLHDTNTSEIRKILKDLFHISEQVAMKEINTDTKGFMQRETLNRYRPVEVSAPIELSVTQSKNASNQQVLSSNEGNDGIQLVMTSNPVAPIN